MRKIVIFLALCISPLLLLGMSASEASQFIEEGNAAYSTEDFEAAIEAYSKVEAEFSSLALFLNLGNAWYRKDNMPKAILYYERARKLTPDEEDVNFNLSKANMQIVDKIEEKAANDLDQWFSGLFYGQSLTFWPWLSVLLLCIGLACFVVFKLTSKTAVRKPLFYIGCGFLIFTVLAVALGGMQKNHLSAQEEAIIMEMKVDVKTAPSDKSSNAFVLHEGTKVTILKSADGWHEIAISNGSVGWVLEEEMTAI